MTRDEALQEALWSYRASSRNATADELRKQFIASLAASGFAIVPVRPTDEMLTVGAEWVGDAFKTIRAYRAMLTAAQEDSHE